MARHTHVGFTDFAEYQRRIFLCDEIVVREKRREKKKTEGEIEHGRSISGTKCVPVVGNVSGYLKRHVRFASRINIPFSVRQPVNGGPPRPRF